MNNLKICYRTKVTRGHIVLTTFHVQCPIHKFNRYLLKMFVGQNIINFSYMGALIIGFQLVY